jgi:serine/threonine protein kinase
MVEDREFVAMFIDEARIALLLDHPNVLRIHELGKHRGQYYLAMEYLAGCDLRVPVERLRRSGEGVPPEQAASIALQVADALDHAHRRRDAGGREMGIIHRDVSPQNVLISFQGQVKLIDFGIAKSAHRAQETQAGVLKGKFGYMSPEQVAGGVVDRRSDLFALGIVLHEMLTGRRLFAAESDYAILEKVRAAPIPSPRESNPAIPAPLEQIALKALSRDVARRYGWASEMAADLRGFLGLSGRTEGGADAALGEWLCRVCADELAAEQARERAAAAPATELPNEAPKPPRDAGEGDEGGTRFEEVRPPKPS